MDRKEYLKNYRDLHKEETKEYKKVWYEKNKDTVLERSKRYYQDNKQKIKERNKMNAKEHTDMNRVIKDNVTDVITTGLKEGYFEPRLEMMLGYTYTDMKKVLETKFCDGMTWGNFGSRYITTRNWHIHHSIPMKIYNFYEEEHIKMCWDLRNLSPKWNDERNDEIYFDEIKLLGLDDILPETILMEDLL